MVSSNSIPTNNLRIGFVSTRFESTDGVSFYAIDIKPKGFQAIQLDGFLTNDTITEVQKVLNNPKIANEMSEHTPNLRNDIIPMRFSNTSCKHCSIPLLGKM